MKRVLITGGAGYLGSVMVPALLEEGYAVTVLDSFLWKQNSLLSCCASERFHIVRGDCRDPAILKKLVAEADIVIPLAALVGAPLCKLDPQLAVSVNLDAVRLLVGMLGKDQMILYPTTNSGYGIGEKDKFCTEESPLRPLSLYGTSKMDAENEILAKPGGVSFRLATVFGMSPRMRIDLLVNDFVHRAVRDRSVVIFEGHFKRNYIHIRDVARVFIHGIRNYESMRGRPYNVGLEDANLSKLELCAKIQQHIPEFVYFEAPIGEDPDKRDYIVSNQRLASTGFCPEWNLDRGIKELIKGFTILRTGSYANV